MSAVEDLLARTTKTSKRAIEAQERNKQKRAVNLQQREAVLPEDRHISKQQDWSEHVAEHRAASTLLTYSKAVQSFTEFTEEQLQQRKGDPEHALVYFERGAALPSREVIRKWLTWVARTAVGNLDLDRPRDADSPTDLKASVSRVMSMWAAFRGAIKYFNKTIPHEDDTEAFIKQKLAAEEGLNPYARAKRVAFQADVQAVIQTLFTQDALGLFPSRLTDHLRFLLGLNLIVDCTIRRGELAPQNDGEATQVLKWADIELWMFPRDGPTGRLNLCAKVYFRWGKGRKADVNANKPLSLFTLPASMVTEDSCSQLLILALLEEHLRDFTDIQGLADAKPSAAGSKLAFKTASLQRPVMQPRGQPCYGTSFWDTRMEGLGRLCGFREHFDLYNMRRGSFHALMQKLPERSVRRHMGWGNGGDPFPDYEAEELTEDAQAIIRGVEANPLVTVLASASLGRIEPLTELSSERRQMIETHPEYVIATEEAAKAKAAMLKKYRTRVAAKAAQHHDTLFHDFDRRYKNVHTTFRRLALLHCRSQQKEAAESACLKPSDAAAELTTPVSEQAALEGLTQTTHQLAICETAGSSLHLDQTQKLHLLPHYGSNLKTKNGKHRMVWCSPAANDMQQRHIELTHLDNEGVEGLQKLLEFYRSERTDEVLQPQHAQPGQPDACKNCGLDFSTVAETQDGGNEGRESPGVHSIQCSQNAPSKLAARGTDTYWCLFCQNAVHELDRGEHQASHLGDAIEIALAAGFRPATLRSRMPTEYNLLPGLCPWCLTDAKLPLSERAQSWTRSNEWQTHINSHLVASMKAAMAGGAVDPYATQACFTCPMSDAQTMFCKLETAMTMTQFLDHLAQVHDICLEKRQHLRLSAISSGIEANMTSWDKSVKVPRKPRKRKVVTQEPSMAQLDDAEYAIHDQPPAPKKRKVVTRKRQMARLDDADDAIPDQPPAPTKRKVVILKLPGPRPGDADNAIRAHGGRQGGGTQIARPASTVGVTSNVISARLRTRRVK
ncbi:hypothetical protein LTR85_002214 [Meristemomyces frigidus]|nr:hypothetical protein LTR85_002214 [Meristemomyces frigidus]